MHTFKSGLFSGVGADAEYLAERLARMPPSRAGANLLDSLAHRRARATDLSEYRACGWIVGASRIDAYACATRMRCAPGSRLCRPRDPANRITIRESRA